MIETGEALGIAIIMFFFGFLLGRWPWDMSGYTGYNMEILKAIEEKLMMNVGDLNGMYTELVLHREKLDRIEKLLDEELQNWCCYIDRTLGELSRNLDKLSSKLNRDPEHTGQS